MSKPKKRATTPQVIAIDRTINKPGDGGCAFCLLNLSLMLTAPAALVALAVKARRSS